MDRFGLQAQGDQRVNHTVAVLVDFGCVTRMRLIIVSCLDLAFEWSP